MRGYSSITLPLFFVGEYMSVFFFHLPKFRDTVAIAIKL